MGLRRSFWWAFFGVPHGALGTLGARLMPTLVGGLYPMMAAQLDLQPDDDLLDVGCGAARMLDEQARHVRFVAGVDASDIQVRLARQRLAERITAGTAEIVLGDAMDLPWGDGRFSAVCSLNCLKFVPRPLIALQEMARVLRPGGRAVLTFDEDIKDPARSGTVDGFGQWQWRAADLRGLMEEAGFSEVTTGRSPTKVPFQLLKGVKAASPPAEAARERGLAGASAR